MRELSTNHIYFILFFLIILLCGAGYYSHKTILEYHVVSCNNKWIDKWKEKAKDCNAFQRPIVRNIIIKEDNIVQPGDIGFETAKEYNLSEYDAVVIGK